ncbi:MAG: hypothetical protein ACLQUY_28810 [Ktedonobacterales bacterium]
MNMKRAHTSVLLAVAMAICLVVSACSVSGSTSGSTSTTPTNGPSPVTQLSPAWTAVLDQIGPNGEISLSTALQAYTLVFGSLPGVQSPAPSGGIIPSGTLAVRMILQHYSDLTPAQQQAVLQRLGLTAPASAQTPPPPTAGAAVAQAHPGAQTLAAPVVAVLGPTPVPTDAPGTADYRAMVNEFIPTFNAFLKYTLTLPVVLTFNAEPKDAADTLVVNALGSKTGLPALCRINVNPVVNTYTVDNQRVVIAHELMHCYQAAILGQLSTYYTAPPWLIEGSAEWAGELVSGATADTTSDWGFWTRWLANPGTPLFSRSYDAIGFYALLDQAGISPWSVLPAMLTSQNNGLNNFTAYALATKPAPQEVLDEWASSYERTPPLGLDWDLKGPGIIPPSRYGGPKIQAVALANGGQAMVKTPAYTALDDGLTSTADVVLVNISGTSRLHDSGSFERVTSANGSYCTKQGGCVCPQGSPNQGPPLPQLSGLLHLAVTGGQHGAAGTVYGLTLSQFCGKTLPPITLAFCQQLMSLAEANQIMQPAKLAIVIQALPLPAGGVPLTTDGLCNYLFSLSPFGLVVQIRLGTYSGPRPIPEQDIETYFTQGLGQPGVTVITSTAVSGVGDQAGIVVGSYTINGTTTYGAAFWVLYGSIVFACGEIYLSSPTATQQSELQQCAQLVVSRLDP